MPALPPTPRPGPPGQAPVAAAPTATPVAVDPTIEVTSAAGLVRQVYPSGPAVQVPLGQGTLQVTARRLFPDPCAVHVRTEFADGAAEAIPGQVQRQEAPAPGMLAFRLHSGRHGRVAVALEATGLDPFRFTLEVTEAPIVNLADRDQVLRLGVGDRFVLDQNFGLMHEVVVTLTDRKVLWLLRASDHRRPARDVVRRPIHIRSEYQAVRPGRTTLQVWANTGCHLVDPVCTEPNTGMPLDIEVR